MVSNSHAPPQIIFIYCILGFEVFWGFKHVIRCSIDSTCLNIFIYINTYTSLNSWQDLKMKPLHKSIDGWKFYICCKDFPRRRFALIFHFVRHTSTSLFFKFKSQRLSRRSVDVLRCFFLMTMNFLTPSSSIHVDVKCGLCNLFSSTMWCNKWNFGRIFHNRSRLLKAADASCIYVLTKTRPISCLCSSSSAVKNRSPFMRTLINESAAHRASGICAACSLVRGPEMSHFKIT